eukprot:TRINITY_DN9343_c0_g1_i4.p2 TRINITY_DN9343_c0_g1~~TRINITY_DN9343_c0_g1_i4.p2  ORF type:complete len:134 (+),score=65.14 TRINITY_DN9343_c0_g1_i4:61-402(+)
MPSVVETVKTFVDLRMAKKNDEAKEYLTEEAVWTVPTMMGSDTHTGKDNVAKFWVEQDKKMPKIVSITEFEPEGEDKAVRTMVISTMLMKVNLKQTYTVDPSMKIVSSVTAKQ